MTSRALICLCPRQNRTALTQVAKEYYSSLIDDCVPRDRNGVRFIYFLYDATEKTISSKVVCASVVLFRRKTKPRGLSQLAKQMNNQIRLEMSQFNSTTDQLSSLRSLYNEHWPVVTVDSDHRWEQLIKDADRALPSSTPATWPLFTCLTNVLPRCCLDSNEAPFQNGNRQIDIEILLIIASLFRISISGKNWSPLYPAQLSGPNEMTICKRKVESFQSTKVHQINHQYDI